MTKPNAHNRPAILVVDDDPEVLRAVERDLRREFGNQYRILAANSGAAALGALQKLKLRNHPVALYLADQRMPEMTGVEFLDQAKDIYPLAKRILLTAYADTDAAIKAINQVKLDHYLMKPWDPPEEHLYPVLNDLLQDWLASFRPPYEGIRIVGFRWSPKVHEVKDFLGRNLIPYQSIDPEDKREEAVRLLEAAGITGGLETAPLPMIVFPDGTHLERPSTAQVAEKIGLKVRAGQPFYDLIVVGGGPAGLSAAVYGASEGLRTLLVEGEAPGGQAGTSARIENYLGFPTGLTGGDLTRRAVAQAVKFGVEILTPQRADTVRIEDRYRFVRLADGNEVSCSALLIATGVSYRKLNVPGIDRVTGAGVYYGSATTEALTCRDKNIFVVGGGNSAGQAAMYLCRFAQNVTILIRGKSLEATMSRYLIDQIHETANIKVEPYCSVVEVHETSGEVPTLASITLENVQTGERCTLPADAMFIYIGAQPHTEWVEEVVARDEQGFILSGSDVLRSETGRKMWKLDREPYLLESSVPGIFVAGDVRSGSIKRIASGVGEGGMAVAFVHRYLATL
jgi:thioredoxin reductase (NADPH)